MNAINLIAPYRYEGMWVFDDPRVGLDKEPFVSGADTMIDVFVADIPNAENGFRLLFSATPFPGYTAKLEWRREEYGGNWYFSPEFKMEGFVPGAIQILRQGSEGNLRQTGAKGRISVIGQFL